MNSTAEYLAQALLSLPKSDKVKVIDELLGDNDFREATAKLLIDKLAEKKETKKIEFSPNHITSKERGKRLREDYISQLHENGILIEQYDRIWSETLKGLWVAIPTATMEWRHGRWFLGLPEDKVQDKIKKGGVVVILLCQSASGSRLDFVIPPDKVLEITPKLSKSKGQLKFNIKKIGDRYQLVIPNDNPLDLTAFISNISILRN